MNTENEREVNAMNTINEKIRLYNKMLDIVRDLGQELLRDSEYLPDDIIEPIEEIDINIHYLLDCGKE
jgi:hypothetical protein